jgi:hypothetical protein
VKDVHPDVESDMKKVSFKLVGKRFNDTWIDGVELDVKELCIYLIKHYGLKENVRTTGCEITITFDGAKLDDY